MTNPTAALIIIGNEILSGRTEDKNLNFLAKGLGKLGISFMETRVIPDIESTIIDTVNQLRQQFDYVFTTGGIGPTHDDITAESIAKAFNTSLTRHEQSYQRINEYYNGDLNEGRIKMVMLPEGAEPINNTISAAPGFYIENVYVLAGIPNVMQAMFDSIKDSLTGGAIVLSKELRLYTSESKIAQPLSDLQDKYPAVEIGSYPFIEDNKIGVSLVLRTSDEALLSQVYKELEELIMKDAQ